MKTIYNIYEASILGDMEETMAAGDELFKRLGAKKEIEQKTDNIWTVDLEGRYIMYNRKPSFLGAPSFIPRSDELGKLIDNIKTWVDEYGFDIQPIGSVQRLGDELTDDFLRYFNPVWLGKLEIRSQGRNIDLTHLNCAENIGVLHIDNSYRNLLNNCVVVPPKNKLNTALVDLPICCIKNWNCKTLIVENNFIDATKAIGGEQSKLLTFFFDELKPNVENIQLLIDKNPYADTIFIRLLHNNKWAYYPVKVKNGKFVKLGAKLGGQAMKSKKYIPIKYDSSDASAYRTWWRANMPESQWR